MQLELQKISLREKKFAALKLKILDCLISKLNHNSLESISVKEITEELNISEMTFYNYFKNKKELLIYFIELWNIEMNLNIKQAQPLSSVESILLIYELTATKIEKNYQSMMELISYVALNGIPKKNLTISKAEIIIKFGLPFPYKEGGFKELIMPLLSDAISKNEITNQNIDLIYIGLHNTFFGTPILIGKDNINTLKEKYIEQVKNILKI